MALLNPPLDDETLRLLDGAQRGFPLVEQPYAAVAQRLGTTEAALLAALSRSHEAGALSRLGPVFKPNTVGASTLAALAAPAGRLDEVAAIVSSFDEVNHNYERSHPVWNVWFVVTAADEAALVAVLKAIESKTGLSVLDLRLEREFRIDLAFPLVPPSASAIAAGPRPHGVPGTSAASPPPNAPVAAPLSDEAALIAAIQDGVALTPRPFDAVATRLGVSVQAVLSGLQHLADTGALKRFGAVVKHRALGFSFNAMSVWQVPKERLESVGERLAALPFVTLCYQRRTVAGHWPYNLYCMVHGRDEAEVRAQVAEAVETLELSALPHAILFSPRAFKQRGARYGKSRGAPALPLSDADKRLVNRLQDGLPVVDAPYAAVAQELGITEAEVLTRVQALLDSGHLSRFGPMFNVERFGGDFCLVAMDVPAARFDEVADLVNGYAEVAHNYEREHRLNMWFVVATDSRAQRDAVLADIEARTGLCTYAMPKLKEFFLELKLQA